MWLYRTVSLSPVQIVSRDPFSIFSSEASTSTCLQKGRRKRLMTAWRRLRATLPYPMRYKFCHKTLNPCYHERKRVWMSRPCIKLLPSRCTASPKKNSVENTTCAESVAAAAMLALLNTSNAVRCCVQDQWQQEPWCLTSSAKVMTGDQRRRGGKGRTREGEDGNNGGAQQQQCLSSSNQVVIRKYKKAKKTQQSTTKTEAAGTFGCWKRRRCFEADGRGLGTG